MNDHSFQCTACHAIVPIARTGVSKWVGGLTAAYLGKSLARSWSGLALIVIAGIAAGAAVDAAARPFCGHCGRTQLRVE